MQITSRKGVLADEKQGRDDQAIPCSRGSRWASHRRISNWSGKAIAGPRSEIGNFLEREEITSPGVYFLAGVDPETDQPSLYIGEAENVKKRIRQHQSKDDWSQVIAFISKDENLTKSHIRYLEGELIRRAAASQDILDRGRCNCNAAELRSELHTPHRAARFTLIRSSLALIRAA